MKYRAKYFTRERLFNTKFNERENREIMQSFNFTQCQTLSLNLKFPQASLSITAQILRLRNISEPSTTQHSHQGHIIKVLQNIKGKNYT